MTRRCTILLVAGFLFSFFPLFPQSRQIRSFDDLFPQLGETQKREAFSEAGIIRSLERGQNFILSPSVSSGINLAGIIQAKGCQYLTESLLLIPYNAKTWRVLDAYNALGKVRNLKGRLYHSHTRNSEIPLFEDAVRLESDKRTNPIPDPPPSASLPSKELVFIRLKDINFGNTFYRAEISPSGPGLLFDLTNFRTITYLFFPVMREEKFNALLYMEPLAEGMLVYSVAGTDVSDFVARQIDIPSAISKRLAVFVSWISDGLREI
jgi:hypothetical protein